MEKQLELLRKAMAERVAADAVIRKHLANQGRYTVVELMAIVADLNASLRDLLALMLEGAPEETKPESEE